MTDTVTISPGTYQIVPFDNGHAGRSFATLDPMSHIRNEPTEVVKIVDADHREPISGICGPAGRYALTVDLAGLDDDGMATTTPFGPLTITNRYLLASCEEVSTNPDPAEQYTMNWVSFELAEPTLVRVEGSRIHVGDAAIDVAALSDVSIATYAVDGRAMDWGEIHNRRLTARSVTTQHVARAGDPVHAILSRGTWTFDDGVLILLDFTPDMLDDMRALDGPTAAAYAANMGGQAERGRTHTVVRPAMGWNA